ncbi:hypothetical protein K435DRAFT_257605 [Dendrothele bispora CBS 962.96]|uniref:ZZ-type domain-containing protein n=1 Tax=Dendrothele bispora (strain CBS 962.96) TaxID=1314807 RepID=A0A4S8MVX2_DENBC|nr:hypothetical protein K435DRAFT_257605 [Dendrothele bispora CBS 962.96]
MFTVKATYKGECRKISFPECNSFPSFDQLYHQLYRVFPISHNFFLSKLLFSPDSSRSRILVAQEVHSAEEYTNCVSRYAVGRWPNPLLKFSVFEETPHKLPNSPSTFNLPQSRSQRSIESSSSTAPQPQNPFDTPPLQFGSVNACSFPTIPFSNIPPPPIIFSSAHSTPQAPMEIDVTQSRKLTPPPQSQPSVVTGSTRPLSCCAATQRREEVKDLISNLKCELERIVSSLNDMARTEPPMPQVPRSPSPKPMASPVFPSLCQFNFCSQCGVIKQGPWYHCGKCDNKICVNCHDAATDSSCLVATGPHVWQTMTCPSCPETASRPILSNMTEWNAASMNVADQQAPDLPSMNTDHPMDLGERNIWSPTLPNLPSVPTAEPWSIETANVGTSDPSSADIRASSRVVHPGVVCDVCHSVIEGVRHKCLDCADYDLCTSCISSGAAERHNPFHEFFEIAEPGRVIVHTVVGNGERDPVQPNLQTSTSQEEPAVPAVHHATCDLCDSRIRGDRYKCAECPDFDTCQSCFCITPEQHPDHAFVKLTKPEDFIPSRVQESPIHFATCDSCNKTISGVRYKCMHPDCSDFDLCENCEALPIPVHPRTHGFLKIRDPNTVIPHRKVEQPIPAPAPERTPARDYSIERSVPSISENGQIRNAVEDLVYQPPSPFFFRTETGCSNSPTEHQPHSPPFFSRDRSPSPTLLIPGAMPTTFNLPILTPTSPILRSPVLQLADEGRRRSPSPPRLTPLWKRMSLPPLSSPPSEPYNVLFHSSAPSPNSREGVHGEVKQNRRFSQFQSSGLHSEHDDPFTHDPPPTSNPFINHHRFSSPPVPGEWRSFPLVPSRRESQDSLRPESQTRTPPTEEFPITLPPIRSTDSSGLWPEGFQEMRHLMDSIPAFGREFRSFFDEHKSMTNETTSTARHVPEESPLGQEALLNSPPPADRVFKPENPIRSLAAILNSQPEPEPVAVKQTFVEDRDKAEAAFSELPELSSSTAQIANSEVLSAEFIVDRSVPDGQEFPPGAEFMKSWCMLNSGRKAWPKGTELVFVAGEDLSSGEKGQPVQVGAVQPGETIDLWTGELKAPDAPGRYAGYYRLRDETGNLFGHSIWLEYVFFFIKCQMMV